MPYAKNEDLPDAVRGALPSAAQSVFRNTFNSASKGGADEEGAMKQAWGAVKNAGYVKGDDGKWVKKSLDRILSKSEEKTPYQKIAKVDEDRRLVFGWFSVSTIDGEPLYDHEGDYIPADVLEKAAYHFVINARVAGEVHMRKGVGDLVESIMFTKEKQEALGIDLGMEGWWGGFKVTDEDVWKMVKDGSYPMFSIGGRGVRIAQEE